MALKQFDPFRDLMDLQYRINRLFDETSRGERDELRRTGWSPPVDIFEQPDALIIEADLPGLTRSEVAVRIENNILTIQGERRLSHEKEQDKYHRIERSYGSFSRSFTIPTNIQVEKIDAEFKEGVLRIWLPKRVETKPKQIEINVK